MLKVLTLLSITYSLLSSNILCRGKIAKELILLEGGYPSWVVDETHSITFTPNPIQDLNYSKKNPILGLYMIKHSTPFKNREKMRFREIRNKYRFAIDDDIYIEGKILKPQIGLEFAEFSESIEDNVMITSGCCITAGLSVGGNKFIDGDYIRHFVESDNIHLSDVGARFVEVNGKIIVVDKVNPFFTDNPFLEGDEILYIDGEPAKDIDKFLKNILFSPKNRIINFEVLRDNRLMEFSIETNILRGGGLLSDSFLENIGIWFDESLFITNVHKDSAFAKKGLKNNYKLLSINGKEFNSSNEIKVFLSENKKNMPDKFKFLFKYQGQEFQIELKSNRKFFSNSTKIKKTNDFGGLSFGSGGNMGTGSFSFSGSWNGKSKDDTNNSFYDVYNSIPLAEYLSY